MLSYSELKQQSGLDTWSMWLIHEEIVNTLEAKGYGTTNVKLRECQYGTYEAIELDWQIAPVLQKNLSLLGYDTVLERDPFKKSLSWIVFPHNLVEELQKNINELEEKGQ